jgi:hypothetical protein
MKKLNLFLLLFTLIIDLLLLRFGIIAGTLADESRVLFSPIRLNFYRTHLHSNNFSTN